MTYEEVSVVSYLLHFTIGGAVAPPDMGAAYVLRILPILVVAYYFHKHGELDDLINQATISA